MNQTLLIYGKRNHKRELRKFIEALKSLNDTRDNRGKEHKLYFVVLGVLLAILSGRSKLSSIQRYIENRIAYLRQISGEEKAEAVSRAQLPRILLGVDLEGINEVMMRHFGVHLAQKGKGSWKAIDGKTLCGTKDEGGNHRTRIIMAVDHISEETIGQRELSGSKKSEITAVRTFLHETGLEKEQVTLDALHMNPITTAQIEQAGGTYLIQTKANQPTLQAELITIAQSTTPIDILTTSEDGHGRHEERWAWFFNIADHSFDSRWQLSRFRTLVVILRQTTKNASPDKISLDLSYYLSNASLTSQHPFHSQELFAAIRSHWSIEASNWIRDVTFQEDSVITKFIPLAQLLASLRTFAIRLLQRADFPNLQAALERFSDCPDDFLSFLHQAHVL